jgi:hypothetical protein
MIFRFISFICVPVFIWLLIRSYKQIRKEYDIIDNIDFLFNIFWFIGVAWGVISLTPKMREMLKQPLNKNLTNDK